MTRSVMGSIPHQCLWTHLQVCGSKRLGRNGDHNTAGVAPEVNCEESTGLGQESTHYVKQVPINNVLSMDKRILGIKY